MQWGGVDSTFWLQRACGYIDKATIRYVALAEPWPGKTVMITALLPND